MALVTGEESLEEMDGLGKEVEEARDATPVPKPVFVADRTEVNVMFA